MGYVHIAMCLGWVITQTKCVLDVIRGGMGIIQIAWFWAISQNVMFVEVARGYGSSVKYIADVIRGV